MIIVERSNSSDPEPCTGEDITVTKLGLNNLTYPYIVIDRELVNQLPGNSGAPILATHNGVAIYPTTVKEGLVFRGLMCNDVILLDRVPWLKVGRNGDSWTLTTTGG